jgi:hypothetical protein
MSCDVGKRRMYRCYVPAVEGVWAPAVHSNCKHNEWAALALRTMGATPEDPMYGPDGPWEAGLHRNVVRLGVLLKQKGVARMSVRTVVESYTGRMRVKYETAALSLQDEELGARDFKLSAFLKGEKFNPSAKVSKPRMINPRSSRYNLLLATYLKPLEHTLWKYWMVGSGCKPTRMSGKGLTLPARAKLIEEKMGSVGDCVVVEVDGKAFEAHVTRRQLADLEHRVYKSVFKGDRQLARLLEAQLTLTGRTAGGTTFHREGCRASGDFNTGLGNTLLMGSFVQRTMELLPLCKPWTVLADGDNCLLFVSREELSVLDHFQATMSRVCAHEMTVEKPADKLERVVFGQSQPVRTAGGLSMVRNPFKVLSGAFCGYRHFHDAKFAPKLIRGIALAERSLSRGLPVLGPYFERVCELTAGIKTPRDLSLFLEGHLLLAPPDPGWLPITSEARESFSTAFGIGAVEQVELERVLVEGLDRDFLRTIRSGAWLERLEVVVHGRGSDAENTRDDLFFDAG